MNLPKSSDPSVIASPVEDTAEALRHGHVFLGASHDSNARRMGLVVGISIVAMGVELACGLSFRSMALLGDGLHMASHAGVFLVAMLAYRFARRHAEDARFSFGTGKVGDLCGFGSAILLGVVALLIGAESLERLIHPVPIALDEALPIAALGLAVSLLSAWLLRDREHGHGPDAHVHAQDFNLRAAYIHLLSDIVVSLLALLGLAGVKLLGWSWLDAAAGLVGAAVVGRFAWSLSKQAGRRLLDMEGDPALALALRARLEREGDRIADLHVWRLGPGHDAAIIVIASPNPATVQVYRQRIAEIHAFSHLTVEVHHTER
ncbi:MAG: CDF family Co(II)/Ni(II) efflux transporter DmeF [Caulobacteraceae bacterium]